MLRRGGRHTCGINTYVKVQTVEHVAIHIRLKSHVFRYPGVALRRTRPQDKTVIGDDVIGHADGHFAYCIQTVQIRPHVPRNHRVPPARAATECDRQPRGVEAVDDIIERGIRRFDDNRRQFPGVDVCNPVCEVSSRGMLLKRKVRNEGDPLYVVIGRYVVGANARPVAIRAVKVVKRVVAQESVFDRSLAASLVLHR